ncbi:HepT-like ribonuclease domain-containing protein [Rhizobium sp. SSA_523]|uniref:HepT-like ribonuclease domain-containing protein n=1 Tax=Rhizobium sp. SSA_523 TaxID=2952477 RepID=UPI0020911AC5|nr:HepT-like ribonuclease domain-containing protein [Rhizobium sp. SSA_523]MCO5730539.1 DUF86 domain-containing protein [Rhizobium sp. SSA_523]WKC25578.1 DUF86 domain-containing protein [Rhizobium sp. SSA_523]
MTLDRSRLLDHIERMEDAAQQATDFVIGLDKSQFLTDPKSQMAVSMALVILGEAVTRILKLHPHIAEDHPEIPWMKIKSMRNLVAHDYFELEFEVVWKTVHEDLPQLLSQLRALRQIRAQGE